MNTLLSILLVAFTVGCSSVSDEKRMVDSHDAPDKIRIIEIARQAVEANDSWADRAEFQAPVKNADGSWSILAYRIPKTPGGHRLITINQEGKITSYTRGK
jgi:hypothetical protein